MHEYTKTDNNGSKFYYKDKAMTIIHREDGPAIEDADGTSVWYLNGRVHRMDGFAFETVSGHRAWFINDVFIFEIGKNGNIVNRMQ